MQQSPSWEANTSSGSQGTPQISWKLKVHYHIQMCLQPVPILSQINPVHASPPTSWKWKFILILTSHLSRSIKWSRSLKFPNQNPVCTSPAPHSLHMPKPSHASWFDHLNNIWWGVQIIKLLIMWSSPPPAYFATLRPTYPSSVLYPWTLSAYVPTSMSQIMFHTHTKQEEEPEFGIP